MLSSLVSQVPHSQEILNEGVTDMINERIKEKKLNTKAIE